MTALGELIAPRRLGRDFRWLMSAAWTSNIGDGIALAAAPLLIASMTSSPVLVAAGAMLQFLPWLLFGLLCVAGVFNAMDRPIIAILKPDMSADFGWTDADFGRLAAVTQFAAACSFLFTGWLVDRLGVRRSMVVGVTAWSLAALAHGWARSGWQIVAARIGLGATEELCELLDVTAGLLALVLEVVVDALDGGDREAGDVRDGADGAQGDRSAGVGRVLVHGGGAVEM